MWFVFLKTKPQKLHNMSYAACKHTHSCVLVSIINNQTFNLGSQKFELCLNMM